MLYAVYCEDAADSQEKRRNARAAHLQRFESLAKEQRVQLAGPLLGEDDSDPMQTSFKGSLFVVEFDNINQAKAWVAADPYVTAGVWARISVHPFMRVIP